MSSESAASPWECADHWAPGDSALWIGVGASGVYERPIIVVSPAGALVRDPEVTYNDGIFTRPTDYGMCGTVIRANRAQLRCACSIKEVCDEYSGIPTWPG